MRVWFPMVKELRYTGMKNSERNTRDTTGSYAIAITWAELGKPC